MRCAHAMRFGASLQDGGALFRLWAPAAQRTELLLHHGSGMRALPATAVRDGWHEAEIDRVAAGQRYQWRIDGQLVVPDPASRCNPQGPHAPSELVDPLQFEWDDKWHGRPWNEAVFYQLHVGTFTPQGTLEAAEMRLPELAALGITAVQLLPLADFPGRFGWGYDGVLPFAPYHGYGTPQALKRFIQTAHRLRLMVFADVVYNHFGPDGNYLHAYAPQFFSKRHGTAWGGAINFDGDEAEVVREFYVANALYWLQEYRFDGLRFDAVHAIFDERRPDILQTISARVREADPQRHVHLVLENDWNDDHRLAAPGTSCRFDGQWNGDVHHTLHVLLTGEHDGYYAEYDAPVAQLGRCLAHGFARQGAPHASAGAPPRRVAQGQAPLGAMVNFLQNHDQIGNRAFGERLSALAEPEALRLATAMLLMAPSPPLLFMGQEWGLTTPFMYFADWQGELADAVRRGRQQEFAHFTRYAAAAAQGRLPDPCSAETFEACKLPSPEHADADAQHWRQFHADLLHRRARHLQPLLPLLCERGHDARHNGALLQLRWRFETSHVLQMQVNLSPHDVHAEPLPEGSERVLDIGSASGNRLGGWSGRWAWLPLAQ